MEASQLPPGRRCVKDLQKSVVDRFVELQASIFLQAARILVPQGCETRLSTPIGSSANVFTSPTWHSFLVLIIQRHVNPIKIRLTSMEIFLLTS